VFVLFTVANRRFRLAGCPIPPLNFCTDRGDKITRNGDIERRHGDPMAEKDHNG
jgi:hypothetical protein